jgi:hypothetical protein
VQENKSDNAIIDSVFFILLYFLQTYGNVLDIVAYFFIKKAKKLLYIII